MPDSLDIDNTLRTRRTSWLIGLATLGTAISGVLALFIGFFASLSGQWQAAGVCLLAASVAFGALANALLRR
jgi:hypothetical protein